MAEKKHILTYEGLRNLEEELQDLKVNKRKEIAGKIKEAREQGDLSENAEYDAAKDEQRDIEARIEQLENLLKNAEVVVEDEVDLDTIGIGCMVKILDKEFDDELLQTLIDRDDVIYTPHTAFYTETAIQNLVDGGLEAAVDVITTGTSANVVNR